MYGGRNHYNHSQQPHHHFPNHHHKGGPPPGAVLSPESAHAAEIFEKFITTTTFKSVLHHYQLMCNVLRLRPTNIRNFYPKLKNKIRSWKAQAVWIKFDKRASHKCYNHGKVCSDTKVLIIGAGPCGLRAAIEAQLLGAKVVVVEKRDRFSRNNVLHLWPFVIADLKALGAKKFYGKFCAGAIDHISIRQLQCILLKVALLLGVEVFEGVTFEELMEPPEDQSQRIGYHARFSPGEHPVNQYEFDVLIGADGKRNTLMGFKRKEFRGKLAIAITANFINKHSEHEARVQEISGVAFIFNQKFFKDLYAETGIDLENIVYYKDETHYFVMTAKKHSLIDKGVILRDLPDTQQLLHPNNVDRKALCGYAREAADFSTGYQMPHLDFAVNHYGKPDIAMFDFTSMFAAENACRVIQSRGHKLLKCLVGDSLLEPFWPTGSGCARGFLSSFDACWAMRSWASNKMTPLEVIAERESIYRLLNQTTPENLGKDFSSYTLEPSSRYPTVNLKVLLPFQVRHLFATDEPDEDLLLTFSADDLPRKRKRADSLIQPDTLLGWCQKQVAQHADVKIQDFAMSFNDGLALCAIIHRYRPDLIDFDSLDVDDQVSNITFAFEILEREFNIDPIFSAEDLALCPESVSRASMISYVSQIHDAFRGEIPQSMGSKPNLKEVKGKNTEHLDLDDFPKPKSLLNSVESSALPTRISCKVIEESKLNVVPLDVLQQNKKRRNESGSLDANAYQRRDDIRCNREDRLRKQKEQRELNTVRFIRSMRLLHCDARTSSLNLATTPSFRQTEDDGLLEYRKQCAKSMKEKAHELERKLYFPDLKDSENNDRSYLRSESTEEFSDKVKGLEAKFKSGAPSGSQHKPKDMIRAIGRLEKTDWNLSAIEKKILDNPKTMMSSAGDKEKVPKWTKDSYNDKFQNIERRLRENGEDEERIAKYLDIDASLKRLERKLREGSTLETGLRGHNKVSNLANQLSSKWSGKEEQPFATPKQPRTVILPSTDSDLCYFCGTRVYLVERLSAEGKYFHRQCFKCCYCGALLRLGNYIYDRENRYGGKFFCIPHFGLTVRSRAKKPELDLKEKLVPSRTSTSFYGRNVDMVGGASEDQANTSLATKTPERNSSFTTPKKKSSPLLSTLVDDRGTTPERVEFENSIIEHSDEEEYLSEEEWTDRNFGASANELDEDSDDSDYSDLSDEELDGEALESSHQLTADETRLLAESWKRRYSKNELDGSDRESMSESEEDISEEHGADGDESHTATEGEMGEDDEDEEEDERAKRAREVRRLELNINVDAPPRKAETSDSGSDTEVATDEESDTQIDTDSEFAEDNVSPRHPKEIPTIVIDEIPKETVKEINNEGPKKEYVAQTIELEPNNDAERSASLTDLSKNSQPNPFTEQLKRLLQRTESTEAVSAHRTQLKRNYMLGSTNYSPKKSVSTADIGDRFKSFMDKISETQKKLQPAAEPSPAMQAFLNSSPSKGNIILSPSNTSVVTPFPLSSRPSTSVINGPEIIADEPKSPPTEESSETSKSEEGKLFSFSIGHPKEDKVEPLSPSDYDNVPIKDKSIPGINENFGEISEDDVKKFEDEHIDDAKNYALIESYNNDGIIDNHTTLGDTSRQTLVLDNELSSESKDDCIIDNVDIISNKNLKNISDDPILLDGTPVNDIDECFDQLANDAILDIDSTQVPFLSADVVDPSEMINESIDNNSNIKSDDIEDRTSVTKMDESGFKSMEDNKAFIASDSLEENCKSSVINEPQIEIQSPETGGLTEGDLSDWADDNDVIAEDDLKDNLAISDWVPKDLTNEQIHPSLNLIRARIASLESLEDSDSAISVGLTKTPQPLTLTKSTSSVTKESENMEFMDTSGSDSSQEADNTFAYDQLKEENLATPVTPISVPLTKTFPEVENKSNSCIKSKSLDIDEDINVELQLRTSSSDSQCDKFLKEATKPTTTTPKRYEGYIPRFKDRRTPFSLARDSIDVRKTSSTSKPLFTPSKEDIIQRQKNEEERLADSSNSSSSQATRTEGKKIPVKPRDGDLVKDMVMSRITQRSVDKINRRGSRNALHQSFNSSASSLLESDLSLSKDSPGTPLSSQDLNLSSEYSKSSEGNPLMRSSTVPCANRLDQVSSSRTVLPATPLTHPERFRREDPLKKKELFKSTPHLPSGSPAPPELPARAPNISTEHLNASTQTSFLTKPQIRAQSESPSVRRDDEYRSEGRAKTPTKELVSKKDPEERLKELLAERKRKELEEQKKEVRLRDKSSCLKECLEEYRLKRNSAPIPQGLNIPKEKADIIHRSIHRPSRLDIESLQVFSTKLTPTSNVSSVQPPAASHDYRDRSSSFSSTGLKSLQSSIMKVSSNISSPRSSSVTPLKLSSPSMTPSSSPSPLKSTEVSPNKRPVKKSKDRERRRSLIQVFAGMFSKSDDKKKPEDELDAPNTSISSGSNVSYPVSPNPSPVTSTVPPKSPSVKERFSKLRLSRSKKKGQSDDKNRSASVGEPNYLPVTSNSKATSNSFSLPTTPSRTIFSFLSSPSNKLEKRKQSASEEAGSEEDSPQGRDTLPSSATPSTRRQKAVQRAVKQAEQKRLRMAQEIQRQLEECEVKTRELEERGIKVEKALIGEMNGLPPDEPELMKRWFCLVHEKNALVRWQEELAIKARELELDDRHVRLENELRQRMTCSELEKTREDIDREGKILAEIISVIDQKDSLTSLLEEDRKRYVEEDKELEEVHARKLHKQPFQRETGV